jgi:hypothetical protein
LLERIWYALMPKPASLYIYRSTLGGARAKSIETFTVRSRDAAVNIVELPERRPASGSSITLLGELLPLSGGSKVALDA